MFTHKERRVIDDCIENAFKLRNSANKGITLLLIALRKSALAITIAILCILAFIFNSYMRAKEDEQVIH